MSECLSDGATGGDFVVSEFNSLHADLLFVVADAAEPLQVRSAKVAVVEVDCVLVLSEHALVLLGDEVLLDRFVGDLDVPLGVLFLHFEDEEFGPELSGLLLS